MSEGLCLLCHYLLPKSQERQEERKLHPAACSSLTWLRQSSRVKAAVHCLLLTFIVSASSKYPVPTHQLWHICIHRFYSFPIISLFGFLTKSNPPFSLCSFSFLHPSCLPPPLPFLHLLGPLTDSWLWLWLWKMGHSSQESPPSLRSPHSLNIPTTWLRTFSPLLWGLSLLPSLLLPSAFSASLQLSLFLSCCFCSFNTVPCSNQDGKRYAITSLYGGADFSLMFN